MRDADLDDESWHRRETFAYFGAAMYAANVLEVGLAHVLLFSEFLTKVKQEYVRTKGVGFNREIYQADFDKFFDHKF